MICILRFKPLAITAKTVDRRWLPHPVDQISECILATDLQDARSQAQRLAANPAQQEVMLALHQLDSLPPGKHRLTTQYFAFVS